MVNDQLKRLEASAIKAALIMVGFIFTGIYAYAFYLGNPEVLAMLAIGTVLCAVVIALGFRGLDKANEVGAQDFSFWKDMEFDRYGSISGFIIIVAIAGAIATAMSGVTSVVVLGVVAMTTMICITSILAVWPMKWIIYLNGFAVLMDIIIAMAL